VEQQKQKLAQQGVNVSVLHDNRRDGQNRPARRAGIKEHLVVG
jgi:hypothetical protein